MELSERIQRWREHKGVTQAALAKSLGISPSAVAQWELGDTKPSVGHLDKLVTALGITMERFYGNVPKTRAAS